jgi:nicotinate-nucleotide adenylyltransferase
VAARPGYLTGADQLAPEVAREIARRAASAEQIRTTPCGLIYVATNLALTVSATEIRQALRAGQTTKLDLPDAVLDYIQQHHLYQS